MKKLIVIILIIASAAPLFGCNTVSGVGQDLQSASDSVKRKMR